MKIGVLFSGGKDSTYAAFLAKKEGYEISCLISIFSDNKDSFMFHTSAINLVEKQAKLMNVPIVVRKTKGKKEEELADLKAAIKESIQNFRIEGIVTGAVESVYQSSRIQKICNDFKIECFNPLWQKDQFEILKELLDSNFRVIISAVAAYPFDKSWVGKEIDEKTIVELKKIYEKFRINPAGEGGEFESLVLNCPFFRKELKVKLKEVVGEGNSWRGIFE
ncbi:MAG: diphthine--ammonia ligase [Candidatus Pacearchaeota archaeon]